MPRPLASDLDHAAADGTSWAAHWRQLHAQGTSDAFDAALAASAHVPAAGDALAGELEIVRRTAELRSPEGVSATQKYDADAGWAYFDAVINGIRQDSGAHRADLAQRAMDLAVKRTDVITDAVKHAFMRPRPFKADPTISTLVHRPNNPSYPSGHASAAYAAALVLAAFAPDQRAHVLDIAAQVAYSRVYGGVHYPSDVVEGASLAASVAQDVIRTTS